MGRMRRHYISKIIYPKSIVLIKCNGGYCSYGDDEKILNFIGFKGYFDIFDKYKINYILLDDLEILRERNEKENNYDRYLLASLVKKLLIKSKEIIKEKYRGEYG